MNALGAPLESPYGEREQVNENCPECYKLLQPKKQKEFRRQDRDNRSSRYLKKISQFEFCLCS